MGTRGRRLVARTAAVVGACALVGASPGVAQAATEYDGEATALRIEDLSLTLFPNETEALPPELRKAIKDLQAQAPSDELKRQSLTLAFPDQVIGHTEYPGTDTQGGIPPNPLITAEVLPAKSVKQNDGELLSEAGVADLSLGGGVLSANLIKSQCVGDGETLTPSVSQVRLRSNEDIAQSEVTLKPGTEVPITGVGTLTFNTVSGDQTNTVEATNLVIDLDSNLSLEELGNIFEDTSEVRKAVAQILEQLGEESTIGGEGGLDQVTKPLRTAINEAATPAEEGGDKVFEEVTGQTPKELDEALNNVAHLDGTITIANAACAQQTVTEESAPSQPQPQQAVPAQPVADSSEPPLADTGTPAGMVGFGLAGLAALAGGGFGLARLRRHGA